MNEFNNYFRNRVVGSDNKMKFDQLLLASFKNSFKNIAKTDLLFTVLSGKLMKVSKEDYLSQLRNNIMLFER